MHLLFQIVAEELPVFRQNTPCLGIVLCNRPDGPAGNAESQVIVGNILRHNRSGTDDDIITDMDSAQNSHISSDPDIVSNMDILCKFCHSHAPIFTQAQPFLRQQWMIGCQEGNIGPDTYIIANEYAGIIHDDQIKIGKKVFSDIRMAPVIELKRPLKIKYLPYTSRNLAHDFFPMGICLIQSVIFPAQPVCSPFDFYQLFTTVVKHMA